MYKNHASIGQNYSCSIFHFIPYSKYKLIFPSSHNYIPFVTYYSINRDKSKYNFGAIPCLALGAQISSPSLILDFFLNKGFG